MTAIADQDLGAELQAAVGQALRDRVPLRICSGDTKAFYGRRPTLECQPLEVGAHTGVVVYEPTELAVTARCGTRIAELEALLAEHQQQLPFEPPAFGPAATVGGMVAAGLSGPRRPYAGAVRDALLGVRLINGRGEIVEFGGRVMKNVAGYDLSRLMAGAMGTLGLLLEVSLRVRPMAAMERTVAHRLCVPEAVEHLARWAGQPLGITATAHDGEHLYVRLCGGERSLETALAHIGGEFSPDSSAYWRAVKEQTHPFFAGAQPLWRVSMPPAAAPLPLRGETFMEWGGALRWLKSDAPARSVRAAAAAAGGHACLFRGHDGTGEVFQPLPEPLLRLHQRLKHALDPNGVFNAGRLYPEL